MDTGDNQERESGETPSEWQRRMEAVQRLAGGAAHHYNNLLCAMGSYSSFLLDALPTGSVERQDALEIKLAVDRAALLTRRLLAVGRAIEASPAVVGVESFLKGLSPSLHRILGSGIDLCLCIAEDTGSVRMDPAHFEQVMTELAANARDAMPRGGRLTVSSGRVPPGGVRPDRTPAAASRASVFLDFTDTGAGIAAEILPHIFEPFFTTQPMGGGFGLGLSVAYGLVTQAGGSVTPHCEPGRGACFRIVLPAAD